MAGCSRRDAGAAQPPLARSLCWHSGVEAPTVPRARHLTSACCAAPSSQRTWNAHCGDKGTLAQESLKQERAPESKFPQLPWRRRRAAAAPATLLFSAAGAVALTPCGPPAPAALSAQPWESDPAFAKRARLLRGRKFGVDIFVDGAASTAGHFAARQCSASVSCVRVGGHASATSSEESVVGHQRQSTRPRQASALKRAHHPLGDLTSRPLRAPEGGNPLGSRLNLAWRAWQPGTSVVRSASQAFFLTALSDRRKTRPPKATAFSILFKCFSGLGQSGQPAFVKVTCRILVQGSRRASE